jgi:peptidoglycan-associated lipoprotein
MRARVVLALIPLLMACSTAKPSGLMVGNLPADSDISGRWSGSWVGPGLFHAMRQENLSLDLTQKGNDGYGRMVLDGATAAESVPWHVRQQGLGGIRVFAKVSGQKVKLTHEEDDRIFTANLVLEGDQLTGEVKGRPVRLILARQAPPQSATPQAAKAVPQMPAQIPVATTPEPATPQPEPTNVAAKPEETQRPRSEDFVAVPELKPIYFDFDKSALRPDAVDALAHNATWLKENADTLVLIEGNCDERGTAEYNLALGDRRAKSAMDYLEANGIPKERLATVSYGKERPVCTESSTEACRSQNRRADFKIKSR